MAALKTSKTGTSKTWMYQGREYSMEDKIAIAVTRDDLGAFHRAVEVATGHLDEVRGNESRVACVERLVRLRKAALDAIWDHDDVPPSERSYG